MIALGEELNDLFRDYLELCKPRSDETFAIIYTADSWPEQARRPLHELPLRPRPRRLPGKCASSRSGRARPASTSSTRGRSLGRAFELGASKDGARVAGLTHPQRFENYPDFTLKPLAGYRHFTGSSEV
ncbi:MAG: hypothetical protein EXQ81_03880, partial [Thermoleophilia bacterium]|nr:hypothetical protein [Thermoleophilia bacterium]